MRFKSLGGSVLSYPILLVSPTVPRLLLLPLHLHLLHSQHGYRLISIYEEEAHSYLTGFPHSPPLPLEFSTPTYPFGFISTGFFLFFRSHPLFSPTCPSPLTFFFSQLNYLSFPLPIPLHLIVLFHQGLVAVPGIGFHLSVLSSPASIPYPPVLTAPSLPFPPVRLAPTPIIHPPTHLPFRIPVEGRG